jgi:hypothetical protein
VSNKWTAILGTHKVQLWADKNTQVDDETNENNNKCTWTFTAVTPQPDLIISEKPSLNSGTLVTGNIATFKGTIKNDGTADAVGIFNNRFRIDYDNNGDWNKTLSYAQVNGLTTGSSQEVVSGNWTAIEGTHKIQLCADKPNGVITESDETNNCGGDTEEWIFIVGPSGNITVNGSLDGIPWGGDVSYQLLGPTTEPGSSVSDTHYDLIPGIWILDYLSGGPIGAYLDSITPLWTQPLTDGGTITFGMNFLTTPPAPKPDLIVTSGPTPDIAEIEVGDIVKFTSVVKNNGSFGIPAGTDFHVRFYVDDVTLSTKKVTDSLEVGGTVDVTSPGSGWSATSGVHTIKTCADTPTDKVDESNENNNCRSTNISVTLKIDPACSDTADNDEDTWIDAEDPGCWTDPTDPLTYDENDDDEVNTGSQCSDGLDNDGDGLIDGDDPDCKDDPTTPTEADIGFEEF